MTSTSASGSGRTRSASAKRGTKGKFTKKEEVVSPDVLVAQRLEERANARPLGGIAAYMQAARDSEEKA